MLSGCTVIMAAVMLWSPPHAGAEETLVSPVFVLGVMKSGTTALCERLSQNPSLVSGKAIGKEPPHWGKELHFFDNTPRYTKGLDFLHTHYLPFPPPEGSRFVDCTPTYLGSLNASKRIQSTYAALTGAARPKFVVVMRPALDRAVSHWSHAARMSKVWIERGKMDHWTVTMTNKGNFTSFVTKAITMWNECSEGRPASDVWEHCSEPGLQAGKAGLIFRGMLDPQFAHWWRSFPKADFCLMTMSNMYKDTAAAVLRVSEFLGVSPDDRSWADPPEVPVDSHSRPKADLDQEQDAVAALREFYAQNSKIYAEVEANGGWLGC